VRVKEKTKQKILSCMRIGIVKQLYKDKKISSAQYQFLINKYGGDIAQKET
jgi:hypothetical protein